MSPTKELAKQDTSTEVAERDAVLEALRAQQDEEFVNEPLVTPLLKIGEPLTKEVQDPNNPAQAGEFINSLTNQPLGRKVDFIVAWYQRGRMAVDRKTNRVYIAFGDLIPEQWVDLVGESFVGTRFDEYPDAEEQFKADVNAGKREWEKGPLVSTTYNYTGLVLAPLRDEDDQIIEGEYEMQPVRLALKRLNTKSHAKIQSLRKAFLRSPKMFYDRIITLETKPESRPSGTSHIVIPTIGRPTTPDEKLAAFELASEVAAGRVVDNSDADSGRDMPVEPDAKGGVAL